MRRYSEALAEAYRLLGFRVAVIAPPDFLSKRATHAKSRKWLMYIEQLVLLPVLMLISRLTRFDLVHFADHSDALVALVLARGSYIVTCHDLIAVQASLGEVDEFQPGRMGKTYQRLVRLGLARARIVIAVSSVTAQTVHRLIPGAETDVVHLPVSLFNPHSAVRTDVGDYVICVADDSWRKKRVEILGAWLTLKKRTVPGCGRLIVLGPPLQQQELDTFDDVDLALLQSHVEARSGLSDREVGHLYRNASFLLQLSPYEGFCWPIAEANLMGVAAVLPPHAVYEEVGPLNVFLPTTHWDDDELIDTAVSAVDPAVRRQVRAFALSNYIEPLHAESLLRVLRRHHLGRL